MRKFFKKEKTCHVAKTACVQKEQTDKHYYLKFIIKFSLSVMFYLESFWQFAPMHDKIWKVFH